MNIVRHCLFFLIVTFVYSCSDAPKVDEDILEEIQITELAFQSISLENLQGFEPATKNWSVVGSIYADRRKEKTFITEEGTGILVNTPNDDAKENLYSSFEHGDIEIELDVMMPVGSNSGLYFQSRYEVQLFDSWGNDTANYDDIGGIYRSHDPKKKVHEFEGSAPKINASKAPGLWQHLRVIFRAPTFDADGNKLKNALFEEVWLNGILVQENIEVPCPTASSPLKDERPKGTLMIQADHGPVAIRNVEYKVYEYDKVQFKDVVVTEYIPYENSDSRWLPSVDSLTVDNTFTADSVSSLLINGSQVAKMIVYKGKMVIPIAGNYLFEMKVNWGAGQFIVDKDILLDLDGDYNGEMPRHAELTLPKGEVPFTVVYSKNRAYQNGFSVSVEGPEIEKHAITAPSSLSSRKRRVTPVMELEVANEVVLQRGFVYHKGSKKTHNIFVGLPGRKSVAFDLSTSSLLQVWGGGFIDVAPMWYSRGNDQIGKPMGTMVAMHGGPDFASLDNEKSVWPDTIPQSESFKQIGYSIDELGNPKFQFQIDGSVITNEFQSQEGERSLKRLITASIKKEVWHKVAGGTAIELLPDGTYAIDDKSYYIIFPENAAYAEAVRKSKGNDELLIKIPTGDSKIEYSIIW